MACRTFSLARAAAVGSVPVPQPDAFDAAAGELRHGESGLLRAGDQVCSLLLLQPWICPDRRPFRVAVVSSRYLISTES